MSYSSHKNYKTWIVRPFETDKAAANGNPRLCLKWGSQVKCQ